MSSHPLSAHRLENPSLYASHDRRAVRVPPTKATPLIISASELSEFLRCRVRHHWSYQCQLTSLKRGIPRAMGILGHEILEHYYAKPLKRRSRSVMKRLARKAMKDTSLEELGTADKDLLTTMLLGYVDWTQKEDNEYSDAAIGLDECVPEEWFELPLDAAQTIIVRGKLDCRFKSTTRRHTMGILESKFKSQIRVDDVDNRLQLSVYLWALRMKFPKMKRFIAYYQILRKQAPSARVRSELFHREPVERDAEEIDQWALDASRAARDMLDGAVYPNPNENCSWDCDFRRPCLLRGNHADLKFVLSNEYTKRS